MGASGMLGYVNDKNQVRSWQIDENERLSPFVNSGTAGAAGRNRGVRDWTGNYAADGAEPAVLPGEAFTFTGYTGSGKQLSGPARAESLTLSINIENADPVRHSLNFGANGALAGGSGTGADAATSDPENSLTVKVYRGADIASLVELPDVRSLEATLTAALKSYASSSTAGHTKRNDGPRDLTLSIPVFADDLSALPARGAIELLRIVTDLVLDEGSPDWTASKYWDIAWIRWAAASSFLVNIETGDMIGCTLNAELSIVNAGGMGRVVTPAGIVWIGTALTGD